MSQDILIKRGTQAELQASAGLNAFELGYTSDKKGLWIGNGVGDVLLTEAYGLKKRTAVVSSNTVLDETYFLVFVDTTLLNITISLPDVVVHSGRLFAIKKIASENIVTIAPLSGLIDGVSSITLNNNGDSVFVAANGEWKTLANISAALLQQHRPLNELVHVLAEDAHCELIRTSGKITSAIYWDSPSKVTKIREYVLTRTNDKLSSAETIQYNESGVETERMTYTLNRVDEKVVSIDESLT